MPTFVLRHGNPERGEPEAAKAKAEQFLAHRRRTQPVEPGRTLSTHPATLPDDDRSAGLKGTAVGGARSVNCIIHHQSGGVGGATSGRCRQAMELIQQRVAAQSGVVLEAEIQMAGEWGSF